MENGIVTELRSYLIQRIEIAKEAYDLEIPDLVRDCIRQAMIIEMENTLKKIDELTEQEIKKLERWRNL